MLVEVTVEVLLATLLTSDVVMSVSPCATCLCECLSRRKTVLLLTLADCIIERKQRHHRETDRDAIVCFWTADVFRQAGRPNI